MKNITTEPAANSKIIPNEYYALEGQTVCVIRMVAVALKLSLKNRVLYITDDEEQYDQFKKLVINNKEFGNDDNALLVKNGNKNFLCQKLYDNMGKFLEMNNMKKFDYIIGNPPYGQHGMGSLDLHFEIAEKCIGMYKNEMIFLMPDRLGHSTSEKFDKWRERFNMISSITDKGAPFKDATASVAVYVFKNHAVDEVDVNGRKYKTLSDIVPFSEYENQFMKKLFNNTPNFFPYRPIGKQNKEGEGGKTFNDTFFSRFSDTLYFAISCLANGAGQGKGIFISSDDTQLVFKKTDLIEYLFAHKNFCKAISIFKTKKAAINYVSALQRPLLRFGLAKLQDDQNMTSRVRTYIPDIDWNDDQSQTDVGILLLTGFSKKDAEEFSNYCENFINAIDEKNLCSK